MRAHIEKRLGIQEQAIAYCKNADWDECETFVNMNSDTIPNRAETLECDSMEFPMGSGTCNMGTRRMITLHDTERAKPRKVLHARSYRVPRICW